MNYAVKNIYGKTNGNTVTVTVPGSKSVTARAMLVSALAGGVSTLYGAQYSDDCQTFLNCLSALGVESVRDGTTLKIKGSGGRPAKKKAELFVGSAGTAARFLPALLALSDGDYYLNCSEQMKTRPIASLINSLKALGAQFVFPEKENSYPFIIRGAKTVNTNIEVDISESSQFLSALLISSVCASNPINIKAVGAHGRDYIDMTVSVMRSFGVAVKERDGVFTAEGEYKPQSYRIEPDVSSACYFYAINRILGTNIRVDAITPDSMQGDMKFIKLIKDFDGGKIDMGAFSDQALTLSAIAPYFKKPTEITGVAHIRRQECDRIRAIAENLTAMGVKCEEREDGVKIYPSAPKSAHINSFGDHRVAMSFAVTGLRADGIVIDDAEVCSKTFKNYFGVFGEVIEKVTGHS